MDRSHLAASSFIMPPSSRFSLFCLTTDCAHNAFIFSQVHARTPISGALLLYQGVCVCGYVIRVISLLPVQSILHDELSAFFPSFGGLTIELKIAMAMGAQHALVQREDLSATLTLRIYIHTYIHNCKVPGIYMYGMDGWMNEWLTKGADTHIEIIVSGGGASINCPR